MFIGAALSATAVIASGGSSAAARNRGTRAIVRRLRRGHVPGINPEQRRRIGFVRTDRSTESEARGQEVLLALGAEAVRVHKIDKRLEDIPLSLLRAVPWLGDERLGYLQIR
jgi:hypothetical protein